MSLMDIFKRFEGKKQRSHELEQLLGEIINEYSNLTKKLEEAIRKKQYQAIPEYAERIERAKQEVDKLHDLSMYKKLTQQAVQQGEAQAKQEIARMLKLKSTEETHLREKLNRLQREYEQKYGDIGRQAVEQEAIVNKLRRKVDKLYKKRSQFKEKTLNELKKIKAQNESLHSDLLNKYRSRLSKGVLYGALGGTGLGLGVGTLLKRRAATSGYVNLLGNKSLFGLGVAGGLLGTYGLTKESALKTEDLEYILKSIGEHAIPKKVRHMISNSEKYKHIIQEYEPELLEAQKLIKKYKQKYEEWKKVKNKAGELYSDVRDYARRHSNLKKEQLQELQELKDKIYQEVLNRPNSEMVELENKIKKLKSEYSQLLNRSNNPPEVTKLEKAKHDIELAKQRIQEEEKHIQKALEEHINTTSNAKLMWKNKIDKTRRKLPTALYKGLGYGAVGGTFLGGGLSYLLRRARSNVGGNIWANVAYPVMTGTMFGIGTGLVAKRNSSD